MDSAYHPVDPTLEKQIQTSTRQSPTISESAELKSKRRFGLSLHIVSHIIGFLWIAPIIALLVLNFTNHVIGASIWCPKGNCNAQAYGENAIATANRLDVEDHDILGALQFVAKALEVWFMVVATGLVYDVALFLAKSSSGLPIGYLFTHLEFADIRNLVNPLLWTSPLPHGNLMPSKPAGTWKLYLFAALAAFLTILTNLMGPATAVLVLPTLQWVDSSRNATQAFNSFAASSAPQGDTVIAGCNSTQLAARDYNCTSEIYGPSMDNWLTQALSTTAQAQTEFGSLILGTTQEGLVEFTVNATNSVEVIWVPSRQVLRSLSSDLMNLALYVTGNLESNSSSPPQKQPAFNNSLETVLQREGPSLGLAVTDCFASNVSEKTVAENKRVRCMDGWKRSNDDDQTSSDTPTYTKCFRVGTGWSSSNENASFYLGDADKKADQSSMSVYSSDKATFFNATMDFGSHIEDCMKPESKSCDWEAIFNTAVDPALTNTTTNALITEYRMPEQDSSTTIWCEAFVYSSFPTYSLDTAGSANPLLLTKMNKLPSETDKNFNKTTIPYSPDWVLAAWSVTNSSTVDPNRQIGKELARVIPNMLVPYNDTSTDPNQEEFYFIYLYSMAQSLSFVNYYYTEDPVAVTAAAKAKDKSQPVFHTWATLRVWAYGLSGRTPKLGVAVAIAGCICVLLRLILSSALRIRHELSTVELFVAALEHHPTQEFDNVDDEAKMAKVRYIMQDGEKRPRFVSGRVYSGGLSSGLDTPRM